MNSSYRVLAAETTHEIEVQRSRFIARLAVAATVDEAEAFIARIRREHPEATHHCWAYLVGSPGSSGKVGFSDDGEPHNTAGRPMLQVLSHCERGDLVAVVVRYYGGTKLGRGGLVRAYGGAVKEAIEEAPTTLRIDWRQAVLRVDYSVWPGIERMLDEFGVEMDGQSFGARVQVELRCPRERSADFIAAVSNASRGRADLAFADSSAGKEREENG